MKKEQKVTLEPKKEKKTKFQKIKKGIKWFYTPIGSKGTFDFLKRLLFIKEISILNKKIGEFFLETKKRITRKPYTIKDYNDWTKYVGITEKDSEKEVYNTMLYFFLSPSIIILMLLLGAIFFCDVKILNYFIYISSTLFLSFIIPTYLWWRWIYKNKKYKTFKNWILNK